jgi:hypothetical protein
MLGLVLLYVGVVLIVNGIWLLGQARAAAAAPPAGETVTAPAGTVAVAEAHPFFIQNREVAILNVFTGFVGVVAAVTLAVQGNADGDNAQIRGAGYILLFAFTYLWVAYNQFANAGGHAFGWYCLFVAITAVVAGALQLDNANGDDAGVYLAIDWFAWAILWGMFFALLALDRPILRLTGAVAVLEGIGTAWIFGILLLEGKIAF